MGVLFPTCLSSVGGQGWGGAGYDFSNFYVFSVLYLPHVFLPFSSLTQKLRAVRPARNGEEDDLFLHWSETTQEGITNKRSNFSKEWHPGSKFPVSHLENLTELGIGMQSHFLCQSCLLFPKWSIEKRGPYTNRNTFINQMAMAVTFDFIRYESLE